jgi:hypothetical protein
MLQNFVSASPAVKPTVFTGDGIMAVFGAPVAAGFRQLERTDGSHQRQVVEHWPCCGAAAPPGSWLLTITRNASGAALPTTTTTSRREMSIGEIRGPKG